MGLLRHGYAVYVTEQIYDIRLFWNKNSFFVKKYSYNTVSLMKWIEICFGVILLIYLKTLVTSFGSLVVLFILAKVIGNKQMSQINMFDYINSITIGSIAAEMATSDDENFLVPLIGMIIYGLAAVLISILSEKSLKMRRFFSGGTITLMDDNKIYMKNLKKARIELSELLVQFRLNGYFDISQIHSAYLESNGRVSMMPKDSYRPIMPSDIDMRVHQSRACVILILDGALLKDNLEFTSVNENWLIKQIQSQGANNISDVALASINEKKNLTVFLKINEKPKNDYFG